MRRNNRIGLDRRQLFKRVAFMISLETEAQKKKKANVLTELKNKQKKITKNISVKAINIYFLFLHSFPVSRSLIKTKSSRNWCSLTNYFVLPCENTIYFVSVQSLKVACLLSQNI